MNILILGHNGMLGHMVLKYLQSVMITTETISSRWPNDDFKASVKNSNADFLINCIASIPQKKYLNFTELNIKLPIWLAKNFKGNIINPATDGEYSGDISIDTLYEKHMPRDAYDDYGLSKACIGAILMDYDNVKQIRTSINGPEKENGVTLFSWIHKQQLDIYCITNHYWSGITSLEWAKNALCLINTWDNAPKITQLSTKCITKMELLETINVVFNLNKTLLPKKDIKTINRCLKSDYELPNIQEQFIELKKFYYGV
jgi:dTDP-4-dehydrorhamnose reductase